MWNVNSYIIFITFVPTNQPIHLIHNLGIWDIFWPNAFHRYNEIHFIVSEQLILLVPAVSFICLQMKQLKERISLITNTAGILLGSLTCQRDKCHLINMFFVVALWCSCTQTPCVQASVWTRHRELPQHSSKLDWISHGYYFSNAAILHLGPGYVLRYGFVLSHADIKTLADLDRTPLFVSY